MADRLDELNPLSSIGKISNKVLGAMGNQKAQRVDQASKIANGMYGKWNDDAKSGNLQATIPNLVAWLKSKNVHLDVIESALKGIGISNAEKYVLNDKPEDVDDIPPTPPTDNPDISPDNSPSNTSNVSNTVSSQSISGDNWKTLMATQGKKPQQGTRKEFLDYITSHYDIPDSYLENIKRAFGTNMNQQLGDSLYDALDTNLRKALENGQISKKGSNTTPSTNASVKPSIDQNVAKVYSDITDDEVAEAIDMAVKLARDPKKMKDLQKLGYAYLKIKGLIK